MHFFLSLDMTTLFVVRAFVQLALALAIAITTLRAHSGVAPSIWVAGSIVNGVAWSLLPIGLGDPSGDIASIQAALVVLAAVLHIEALARLNGMRLEQTWWPLLPAAVLSVALGLDLDPVQTGTLMSTASTATVLAGSVFVSKRVRPLMRPSTFATLAIGTVLAVGAGTVRALAGCVAPDRLMQGNDVGAVAVIAYAASLLALIVMHMTWLTMLKDRAEKELERLAYADSLTGLGNRRALRDAWVARVRRRFQNGIDAIVMLDVDHFKATNDRWGHEAGDRVLVALSAALESACNARGRAFRLGGEEFCLFLENCDATDADEFVAALRDRLDGMPMLPDASPLRFSAGIAEAGSTDLSLERVLVRADDALYRAKRNGRARSEIAALEAA